MWLFYVLPFVALFAALVAHASATLGKIRLHWNEYRCNPIYMPFAGSIRPDIGTQENFLYCINVAGQDILSYALDAIMQLLGTFTSSLSEFTGPMGLMRALFTRIRGFMISFTASTMSKAATSTSTFIYYLIKIRDLLKRFVGEGYINAYLTYTLFSFIEGFIKLFISIVKGFVIAMLAISIVLALFQPEVLAMALVFASILAAAGA
jgi:hypothetical protein